MYKLNVLGHYECLIESWIEAVVTAHLLVDVYNSRVNITKPNEVHHCYSVHPYTEPVDR